MKRQIKHSSSYCPNNYFNTTNSLTAYIIEVNNSHTYKTICILQFNNLYDYYHFFKAQNYFCSDTHIKWFLFPHFSNQLHAVWRVKNICGYSISKYKRKEHAWTFVTVVSNLLFVSLLEMWSETKQKKHFVSWWWCSIWRFNSSTLLCDDFSSLICNYARITGLILQRVCLWYLWILWYDYDL